MMLVFLLGTSIIFGSPQQVLNAWLAEMMTLPPALLLTGIYLLLVYIGRGHDLYEVLLQVWGGIAGRFFVLGYAVYFLYIATRNLRDLLELIMTSLLRGTPVQVIAVMFILIVAYAAAGGIVVLGRLSILIAAMIIVLFLTLTVLLFFSGSLHPERLLPLLPASFPVVLRSVFDSAIWFPYGELIVFLTFRTKLGGTNQIRNVGLLSVTSAAAILTFSNLLQISALGMQNMQNSAFGLLDASRLIDIGYFITRMDALAAIIFIFGVLLKTAIFLYAGAKGAANLFKRELRRFVTPCALLLAALSLMVTSNRAEHMSEGFVYVMRWLHIPLQLIVPLATFILLGLRRNRGGA